MRDLFRPEDKWSQLIDSDRSTKNECSYFRRAFGLRLRPSRFGKRQSIRFLNKICSCVTNRSAFEKSKHNAWIFTPCLCCPVRMSLRRLSDTGAVIATCTDQEC